MSTVFSINGLLSSLATGPCTLLANAEDLGKLSSRLCEFSVSTSGTSADSSFTGQWRYMVTADAISLYLAEEISHIFSSSMSTGSDFTSIQLENASTIIP
jgi:hypothetical protein